METMSMILILNHNPFSITYQGTIQNQNPAQSVQSTRVPGQPGFFSKTGQTDQKGGYAESPSKSSKLTSEHKKLTKKRGKKSLAEELPVPDQIKVKLFSNIFNVHNFNDMRNFDFNDTPENVRGKATKKSFKEPIKTPADELAYIRNTKARQQKCRTNLITKEMSPSRFLYNLGDSGGIREGGFAHAGDRWTRFLAAQCSELNTYGQ
jgi:hypothetical protein